MNELIHITETNGKKAVSARELYERLGFNPAHWAKWYKKNITDNAYAIESEDWQVFTLSAKTSGGRPTVDFVLSIDFAKRLSMLARTEAGEKIRNYFIEVEKVATASRPQSTLDILEASIRALREQESRVNMIESRVNMIEARTTTRPDYFTVAGYATIQGQRINLNTAARIGSAAAKLCRDNQYEMGQVDDPRFGRVRTYPRDVLEYVFNRPLA